MSLFIVTLDESLREKMDSMIAELVKIDEEDGSEYMDFEDFKKVVEEFGDQAPTAIKELIENDEGAVELDFFVEFNYVTKEQQASSSVLKKFCRSIRRLKAAFSKPKAGAKMSRSGLKEGAKTEDLPVEVLNAFEQNVNVSDDGPSTSSAFEEQNAPFDENLVKDKHCEN